jgi:hypothetical protein
VGANQPGACRVLSSLEEDGRGNNKNAQSSVIAACEGCDRIEWSPSTRAASGRFVRRDRIVSALADGHVAWCNLRGALAFRFGAQPLGPFSARWRS